MGKRQIHLSIFFAATSRYSTEFVIWARKMQKVPHKFNYELMKELNEGQANDRCIWRMPAIGRWEKTLWKVIEAKTFTPSLYE